MLNPRFDIGKISHTTESQLRDVSFLLHDMNIKLVPTSNEETPFNDISNRDDLFDDFPSRATKKNISLINKYEYEPNVFKFL